MRTPNFSHLVNLQSLIAIFYCYLVVYLLLTIVAEVLSSTPDELLRICLSTTFQCLCATSFNRSSQDEPRSEIRAMNSVVAAILAPRQRCHLYDSIDKTMFLTSNNIIITNPG